MSATKGDYNFYEGWQSGYGQAIDDIRQELLTLQQDTGTPIELAVYKILNRKAEEIRGSVHGKVVNLPACEDEEDLVFHNID